MPSKRTPPSKNKTDIKTTVIIILLVVVAFETFLLWNKKQPQMPVAKKIEAVKTPKVSLAKPREPKITVTALPYKAPPVPVRKAPGSAGKIAFVLDDWGYTARNCKYLQAIQAPLAIAILPNLRHSDDIAQCAGKAGKDTMLHLPLEPYHNNDSYPENYLITTNMRPSLVVKLLEDALRKMPYVQGVNNHMGSRATENKPLMTLIFKHLKKHGLFFVDSMTSPNHSICAETAAEIHLPFAQRDVFLDNINTREEIKKQILVLAERARKKGYAVAIGHDRELTLRVLQEEIPVLQTEGFEIVRVKDLVKK